MNTDVVILGKGIAALVLSLLLKQKGIKHLILDRKNKAKHFELAETLPPSAMPLLQSLDLLSFFEEHCIRKTFGYHSMWGSERVTDNHFFFQQPYKFGLKLDKKQLLNQLEERNPTDYLSYDHALDLQVSPTGIQLSFDQDGEQQELTGKIIVDATGRSRAVLKRLQIPSIQYDRNLAFSCHLPRKKHPKIKHDVYVESFREGWGIVSGLGEAKNVLSIFTHSESPIFKQVSDFSNWKTILQETVYLKYFLSEEPLSKLVGGQANSTHPERIAGSNWLAIGDAALAFDPLSSHGISNALYTAQQAAEAIASKLMSEATTTQKELLHAEGGAIPATTPTTNGHLPNDPFDNYHTSLLAIFNNFFQSKKALYASERRWKGEAYWADLEL